MPLVSLLRIVSSGLRTFNVMTEYMMMSTTASNSKHRGCAGRGGGGEAAIGLRGLNPATGVKPNTTQRVQVTIKTRTMHIAPV
jgi:hypothetical protein